MTASDEERLWPLRQMKLSEADVSAQNMRLHGPTHPNTQPFHFLSSELQELLRRLDGCASETPMQARGSRLALVLDLSQKVEET